MRDFSRAATSPTVDRISKCNALRLYCRSLLGNTIRLQAIAYQSRNPSSLGDTALKI